MTPEKKPVVYTGGRDQNLIGMVAQGYKDEHGRWVVEIDGCERIFLSEAWAWYTTELP
jgi:hypothetical protein